MSNIGEAPRPRSWIITIRKRDSSHHQKNVHITAESLAEAAETAEEQAGGLWEVVAGRVLE